MNDTPTSSQQSQSQSQVQNLIRVEFAMSQAEWPRFLWYLNRSSLKGILSWVFFPVMAVILAALLLHTGLGTTWRWAIVGFGLVYAPTVFLWRVRRAHRAAIRQGPHRYAFDDTGLHVHDDLVDVRQRWAAIQRIRHYRGLLLLYFAMDAAHCIPLRALGEHGIDDLLQRAVAGGAAGIALDLAPVASGSRAPSI